MNIPTYSISYLETSSSLLLCSLSQSRSGEKRILSFYRKKYVFYSLSTFWVLFLSLFFFYVPHNLIRVSKNGGIPMHNAASFIPNL